MVLHTALTGECVQNWIPDVLINRKVGVLHAQRDKEILVVQLFNSRGKATLHGLATRTKLAAPSIFLQCRLQRRVCDAARIVGDRRGGNGGHILESKRWFETGLNKRR